MAIEVIVTFALFSVLLDAGMHGVTKWHLLGLLAVSSLAGVGAMSVLALFSVAMMGVAFAR